MAVCLSMSRYRHHGRGNWLAGSRMQVSPVSTSSVVDQLGKLGKADTVT